jgi:hypothetical protein
MDWTKERARSMARRLQVHENIVRNRLEHGGPLQAHEIRQGVRLTHEDFLYLVQMAMPALNRELAE